MKNNLLKKIRNAVRSKSVGANIATVVVWLFVFAYSLTLLALYLWVFFSSFKGRIDWASNVFGLPTKFEFANYKNAIISFQVPMFRNGMIDNVYLEELLLNSGVYIFTCSLAATIAPMLVAYATSKFDFKFNAVLDGIVIVTMILPIIGSDAALIQMTKTLGIYDTTLGMVFMKFMFLGTNYLLFKSAFRGIDKAYSESAYIDGASELRVMVSINVPMVTNVTVIIFMLQLMGFWADWTTPLIYNPTKPTVAYALYELQFTKDPGLAFKPLQFAACLLASIPTLTIFIAFRNKIMGGIAFGGLK